MPLLPALMRRGRGRQTFELKASLVYRVPGQPGLHRETLSGYERGKKTVKKIFRSKEYLVRMCMGACVFHLGVRVKLRPSHPYSILYVQTEPSLEHHHKDLAHKEWHSIGKQLSLAYIGF